MADTLVVEVDELDEVPLELLDPPPELAANPAPWGSATPIASAKPNVMSARLVAFILFLLRKSPGTGLRTIWTHEQVAADHYSLPLRHGNQGRDGYYRP
jgi:hypothetical protein